MYKIMLSGCNGRMGRVITEMIAARDDMRIVAGIDVNTVKRAEFPVFSDPFEFTGGGGSGGMGSSGGNRCDVIIDFSNPASLPNLVAYCEKNRTPIVICTTGHTPDQLERIRQTSTVIPVFRSGNMSLGVNLMLELLRRSATVLGDGFDVEILEKHHNQKLDAPSGTALMLADAVASAMPYEVTYTCGRSERREKRPAHEIGLSSIRGGTIVGEHSVFFCGHDEILEIKHTALSREVFATGALRAAAFLAEVTRPGMYDMSDVIAARGAEADA